VSNSDSGTSGFSDDELLAPGLAAVLLLAWIAVLSAAGGALLRARDVE